MNSPKNDPISGETKPKTPAERPVEKPRPDDEQNQATTKEFDEEGMGVAPKE